MALLFVDGFDHVDDGYDQLKWDAFNNVGSMNFVSGIGRTGGWGMSLDNWANYTQKNIPNTSEIVFGYAFYFPITPYGSGYELKFTDTDTAQVAVRFYSDGSVSVYRYTTLLGTTDSGIFSMGTWQYFEIKIKFDNSVGTIEIRANGSDTSVLSLTGIDTCHTANSYITNVRLYGSNTKMYIDDLYICDTTGTENNDFLGDVTITTLYPTSDGNSSDFTPSTGVDNYAVVDEPQLVADTDWVSATTVGSKDTYGVTTLEGTADIFGVQVTVATQNITTGTINVRPLSRSGASPADNEGDDFALSQTVKAAMHIFEKEPTDDVAWDTAKVNASEFGIKVQS